MKTIIVGDIHGSTIWKDIIDQEKTYDKIIFLGDYFDSFEYSIEQQVNNFRDIVKLYKSDKDKIILLLGNHDFHYLPSINEKYSGFSWITKTQVQHELQSLYDAGHIVIHYIDGGFLYSHAGYSKTFGIDIKHIGGYGFSSKDGSMYGNHKSQGPLWIRPEALKGDMLEGYIQIVGHTEIEHPIISDNLVLCDTLKHNKYVVYNGGFQICEI